MDKKTAAINQNEKIDLSIEKQAQKGLKASRNAIKRKLAIEKHRETNLNKEKK